MAEQELSAPDEVRRDAKRALQDGPLTSLREAVKFLGGLSAACVALGSGVAALQNFSLVWLVGLILIAVAGGAIAYAVLENARLRRHSALLREVLASEKYYEGLLRAAQESQRTAEDAARTLQTRLDIVLGMRDLLDGASGTARNPDAEK